jgi:hypothetical protein
MRCCQLAPWILSSGCLYVVYWGLLKKQPYTAYDGVLKYLCCSGCPTLKGFLPEPTAPLLTGDVPTFRLVLENLHPCSFCGTSWLPGLSPYGGSSTSYASASSSPALSQGSHCRSSPASMCPGQIQAQPGRACRELDSAQCPIQLRFHRDPVSALDWWVLIAASSLLCCHALQVTVGPLYAAARFAGVATFDCRADVAC